MPRKDAGAKDVHQHAQIVNGQGYSVACAECKQRGPAFHPLLPPATPDGIEQRDLFDLSVPAPQDPAGHVGAMRLAESAGWRMWSGKIVCPACREKLNAGRKSIVEVWLGTVSDD